jgi:ferredoxin
VSVPDASAPLSVLVDRELCMGSGVCITYAPNTFAHDGETKAVVLDVSTDSVESIRSAVEACPTGALTLTDTEGV